MAARAAQGEIVDAAVHLAHLQLLEAVLKKLEVPAALAHLRVELGADSLVGRLLAHEVGGIDQGFFALDLARDVLDLLLVVHGGGGGARPSAQRRLAMHGKYSGFGDAGGRMWVLNGAGIGGSHELVVVLGWECRQRPTNYGGVCVSLLAGGLLQLMGFWIWAAARSGAGHWTRVPSESWQQCRSLTALLRRQSISPTGPT